MQTLIVGPNEGGQRLDKYLQKYMKEAPSSFLYKMMRKKNIVLNGRRCVGNEHLQPGDEIRFFLSDKTMEQFRTPALQEEALAEYETAFRTGKGIAILYEDDAILAVNKPVGILTQKASKNDLSLNEWLVGYLLCKGTLSGQRLSTFKPSVCNRLDRNTSGIVLCGKSLEGLQFLTELIRTRQLIKRYRFLALGVIESPAVLTGWMVKDKTENVSRIFDTPLKDGARIETHIRPRASYRLPDGRIVTDTEAELITGKSHQIRAQLAHIGHPLLGDPKYGQGNGMPGANAQFLHAWQVTFPARMPEGCLGFSDLAAQTITAPLPKRYRRILTERVKE